MILNEEVATYQQVSDKVSLLKVMELLKVTPHAGQRAFVDDIDNLEHPYSNYVLVLGRRVGKTTVASTLAIRELLIPYSNTVLIAPQYRNAQILFGLVLESVNKLGLPIKNVNKGQFTLALDNGASFVAATQTNIESILGSRISLVIYDESQSLPNILDMHTQIIQPAQLDFGMRDNGLLYSRSVFCGTPRNTGTPFHVLYSKQEHQKGWVSYNAPSSSNPMLPKQYIEEQRQIMPDTTFRNELLAEFTSTGASVFFAFNQEVNIYDPTTTIFNEDSEYVIALDWGFRDSTAAILVYVTRSGDYYVHANYQKEATATKDHIKAFRLLESTNPGRLLERYGDPSNPQLILDLSTDYDYNVIRANNKIAPGIGVINELFQEQGYNNKPKLYINKDLKELIRQIKMIEYKSSSISGSKDPFKPDIESGTHYDSVHALRYAVYSHYRSQLAGIAIC